MGKSAVASRTREVGAAGRRLLFAAVAVCWFHPNAAGAGPCSRATLLIPSKGAVEAESRPLLAWSPLPGHSRYRLQVESRVPNGRVLARIDQVVTGTQFVVPEALAEEQAVVKVRVSAACDADTQGTVSELPPRFFIDARKGCPAPEKLNVDSAGMLRLRWQSAKGVAKTEIRVFSASDGRLLMREDSLGSARDLPLLKETVTIALRNRCTETVSETLYRLVTASEP